MLSETFVQVDPGDGPHIDQEVKDMFQKWGISQPKFYVYNTPKRSLKSVRGNRQQSPDILSSKICVWNFLYENI